MKTRPERKYVTERFISAILVTPNAIFPSHFVSPISLYQWACFERLRPRWHPMPIHVYSMFRWLSGGSRPVETWLCLQDSRGRACIWCREYRETGSCQSRRCLGVKERVNICTEEKKHGKEWRQVWELWTNLPRDENRDGKFWLTHCQQEPWPTHSP